MSAKSYKNKIKKQAEKEAIKKSHETFILANAKALSLAKFGNESRYGLFLKQAKRDYFEDNF